MEDIRIQSGASTGSIYHHFKSKEQLAMAVYVQGILDYQEGMLETLEMAASARDGVWAIVSYHLNWVAAQADWSRYLFQMRNAGFMADAEQAISAANKKFAQGIGDFFRKPHIAGAVRSLPVELYIALILGPCQEYARQIVSRPCPVDPDTAISEIAEAAWRAIRK